MHFMSFMLLKHACHEMCRRRTHCPCVEPVGCDNRGTYVYLICVPFCCGATMFTCNAAQAHALSTGSLTRYAACLPSTYLAYCLYSLSVSCKACRNAFQHKRC